MFWMAIEMVKGVLALTVPKFLGNVNFADGMLAVEGRMPRGAVLQEPVVICLPLVRGSCGTVRQKLIKLFDEVADATCPAVGTSCPLFSKPTEITAGSRVREVCGSPPATVLLPAFPALPAEEVAAGGAAVLLVDTPAVSTAELLPLPPWLDVAVVVDEAAVVVPFDPR
jgi:hypothetical protein